MKPQLLFFFVAVCGVGLVWGQETSTNAIPKKQVALTSKELQTWWQKDMATDTIPGISLEKAYQEILSKKKQGKKVIVAVIDTEVDINHEDLKEQIWINPDEIPNNNIDDDGNGYADDMYGWNFIGTDNENIIYSNYEVVRILRAYKSKFEGKTEEEITPSNKKDFELYQKAKVAYDELLKLAIEDQKHGDFLSLNYPKSKQLLKTFFPKEDYNLHQVDSLYNIYKDDQESRKLLYFMSDFLEYDLSEKWINDYKENADYKITKILNLDFNDRKILGDDPTDINDKNYGSGNVSGNIDSFYHGTVVAGIIGASRNNAIGIDGISNTLKIMSLNISSNGEEHDKDVALAIRYAVDNGAKVINMSFAKDFSMHQDWVNGAIEYASKKDVLIINAGSNESNNVDETPVYPNDVDSQGNEYVSNFIKVGSISNYLDKNFRSYFSNYGKVNIDLFAPGDQIYTTEVKNSYGYHSGTSMSTAVVSGISCLLRSYYPEFSASQIKDILMKSGTLFNIDVQIEQEQEDESQKLVPFSSLSKSGTVVNAYNALLMAEEISRQSPNN